MTTNKKCCEPNTCVEIVPSKCVKYTGTPTDGGPIDKEFNCTPYLNDIIGLFDDDLKDIIAKIGVNKTSLDSANTACGLGLVNTANLSTYEVNSNSYAQGEVIVQLLNVICALQKEVNYLKNGSATTNTQNVFWLDLPLDQNFKNFITTSGSCLITQPCVPAGGITTLRLLLQAMITKLCTCCD